MERMVWEAWGDTELSRRQLFDNSRDICRACLCCPPFLFALFSGRAQLRLGVECSLLSNIEGERDRRGLLRVGACVYICMVERGVVWVRVVCQCVAKRARRRRRGGRQSASSLCAFACAEGAVRVVLCGACFQPRSGQTAISLALISPEAELHGGEGVVSAEEALDTRLAEASRNV